MMNHHARQGFQTTFLNDIYHVEEQLQAYDPYLYLMYNPKTGEHLIMDGLLGLAVMKIPQIGFPELTSKVVEHIKKIHTANGFSATQQVTSSDQARERENNRVIEDMALDFAKEFKEAGINAFNYGIVDGHKKYVHGASVSG